MKSKKARLLIVGGLVMVIVCAGAAFWLLRGPAKRLLAGYKPPTTPENAARDYQLALVRGDFEEAYSHLSPTLAGYPATLTAFEDDLAHHSGITPDVCMYADSAEITGQSATVTIRKQWYDACVPFLSLEGPMNLQYSTFTMNVQQEGDVWRVVNARENFASCWTRTGGCQ